MKRQTDAEVVAHYRQMQEHIGGCGDGNCVIQKQTGQHTNGGCRCLYHPEFTTLQRVGHLLRIAQEMADRLAARETSHE